jgi:TldD protein
MAFVATDIRPLVRLNVSIVEDNGRRETGSFGCGGRGSMMAVGGSHLEPCHRRSAGKQALTNLRSVDAPAGEMTVLLGPGWPGVLLHEAVGHGLEGDFNRKGTSAFSGRSASGSREGRDRGRRWLRSGRGPARLALDRRRGHADAAKPS